jgi:hypothetical protein
MTDPESSPSRQALAARIAKYAYNPSSSSSASPVRPQRQAKATPDLSRGSNTAAGDVAGGTGAAFDSDEVVDVDEVRRSPRRRTQARAHDERNMGRDKRGRDSGAESEIGDGDWEPGYAASTSAASHGKSLSITPTKRSRTSIATSASPSASPASKAKKGKIPRGYAPPETYAHLKNTPDHLRVGLRGTSPSCWYQIEVCRLDAG